MAKKIQAWTEFGPRLESSDPMTKEELIENIVAATNQTKGSLLAALAEMDVQVEAGLKAGRVVHLPNGTHFRPVGRKDGSVAIRTRVNPEIVRNVNADYRGDWRNAENIGASEEQIIALWNEAHPTDPIDS